MAQHTPGPWEYNDPAKFTQGHGKFSEVAVYAPGNAFPWRMAEVSGPTDEIAIANARLIAAAPDLLAALESVRDLVHTDAMQTVAKIDNSREDADGRADAACALIEAVDAAIAKARA